MAKEITHILAAQGVLRHLKSVEQTRLSYVIEKNLGSFFLGAIIPDSVYYDVAPFRLNTHEHSWIARDLHRKEFADNDAKATGLFKAIAAQPSAWRLKAAFAAGVITHTAADRVFHETIDHHTTAWAERGRLAQATHYEIETLVDLLLLECLGMTPRQFVRNNSIRLDRASVLRLCHFYLRHVMGPDRDPDPQLIHVLRRAITQQDLFLRLFMIRPLGLTVNLMSKMSNFVGTQLQAWNRLSYPNRIGHDSFPVLHKLGIKSRHGRRRLVEEVRRLQEQAVGEAAKSILSAIRMLA
jgi:hypothetical protein